MQNAPNPAYFVELDKKTLAKKGLFINPQKLKEIRNLPQNNLTNLMHKNISIASRRSLSDLNLKKEPALLRRHFNSFLAPIFLHLLENDKKNLINDAKQLDKLILNLDKTSYDPLNTCHMLISLSLSYHWLNPYLTPKQKNNIEKHIQNFATYLYSKTKTPLGYWSGTPLHNITHCAWAGVGIAGFAFSHILDEAKYWLNDAFHYFNLVSWLQAEDGSLIEGSSYGAYETEMRALFYYLSLELLDQDLFRPNHLGLADFYTHLHKPSDDELNHIFPWGDSSKALGYHSPINMLLCLASRHKSKNIQSQTYQILKKGFTYGSAFEWMNIIFYNPNVAFEENVKVKTDTIFSDLNMIFSRDNWSNDATALSFKCGPFQGFKAKKLFDGEPGGSHCNADNASLQLYAKQTDLLIDPGYEQFKLTKNHNTLLINGYGQLGEGSKWFKVNHCLHYGQTGEIIDYQSNNKYACWIADASKTYLPKADLESYFRSVVFLKPNIVLILDEVKTNTKSKFEIYWHTPLKTKQKDKDQFVFQNKKAQLILDVFAPQTPIKINSKSRLYEEMLVPTTFTQCTIENKTKSKNFTCLSAFTIADPHAAHTTKITYKKNLILVKTNQETYKITFEKNKKINIKIQK